MADATLHSIRFKDGEVEFEMTGTADDVTRVWLLLEGPVTRAFTSEQGSRSNNRASGSAPTDDKTRKKTKRTTRTAAANSGPSSTTAGRDENLDKLLSAPVEDFPEIGDDPAALYAGLATLSWARHSLEIDGLTISEVHKFLSQKWRLSHTAEAYRFAFKQQPRYFQSSGRPAVFKLMSRGEKALAEHVRGESES
jgi:hypothetical protein